MTKEEYDSLIIGDIITNERIVETTNGRVLVVNKYVVTSVNRPCGRITARILNCPSNDFEYTISEYSAINDSDLKLERCDDESSISYMTKKQLKDMIVSIVNNELNKKSINNEKIDKDINI